MVKPRRLAVRRRLDDCLAHLLVHGTINRRDVERLGEVSTPQASADIAALIEDNPELGLHYDRSAKTYRVGNHVSGVRTMVGAPQQRGENMDFQGQIAAWMVACFGKRIAVDPVERNHRFLEEALELVQSNGCSASEAHQLVDYVFGRPVGEIEQEAGGVMVTLAALLTAAGIDMEHAGWVEQIRISKPETMRKIRAKQAAKPQHSPLPGPSSS